MIQPKISIITITYNSEKTLDRTIKSIVNQDYDNLEYIIIDGGSTDNTLDIIKSYGDKISIWISEPDNGISDAFNKGIARATGDVVGIINSDDGLIEGALAHVAKAYSDDVDVYRGKVLLWKEDTNTKVVETPSMSFPFGKNLKISHQSTFISKKAYDNFGVFDTKCKYSMDYDLLVRFERAGAKFLFIDQVLAFYTLGGITFSKYTPARRKEKEYIMKKNGASAIEILAYEIKLIMKRIIKKFVKKEVLMKMINEEVEVNNVK